MQESIKNIYGNKIRVRACGICMVEDKILMINHRNLTEGDFWAPPGGGIELNETAYQTLEREFMEETNLKIKPGNLLFVSEFHNHPLHAIELFFEVSLVEGTLKMGTDPEINSKEQIITDVQFLSNEEIKGIAPQHLHGIFKYVSELAQINDLRGYFKL